MGLVGPKRNIPNIITILRIIVLAVILVLLLVMLYDSKNHQLLYQFTILSIRFRINQWLFASGILFLICSGSDWLDGYLARKWMVVSDFGKIMDPIADKILVNCVLMVLSVYHQLVPLWIVLLFVIRDILVDGVRMFLVRQNIVLPATWSGKCKTFLQMIGICLVMLVFSGAMVDYVNADQLWFYYFVQNFCFLISLGLAFYSCAVYCKPLLKHLWSNRR